MKRKSKLDKNATPATPSPSNEIPQDASPHSARLWLILLLLLVVTSGVYWQVSTQDFTSWDDMDNIVKNPDFNPPTFKSVLRYWHPKNTARGLYAPATYTVWGIVSLVPGKVVGTPLESPLNPHAFHLVNLLIHTLSIWAAFLLLRKILRLVGTDARISDWAACAGALLFGLHPVQVESVSWISGTKDLLCGLFSIIAVWQYVIYTQTTRNEDENNQLSLLTFPRVWHPRYLLAIGAFLLAMFAKPSGVVMPLVASSIAFFALKRPLQQVVADMAPLLVLAGVFVFLNKSAQQSGQINQIPFGARFLIAGDAVSFYLSKFFVPIRLCIHYGRTPEQWYKLPWKELTGILPYVLVVGIGWIMLLAKSAREPLRWLLAGLGVFVAGVLPVLGFVGFMFQRLSTVADHYLYLPMLGPALILAYLLSRKPKRIAWGVAAVWLCVLAVLASVQVTAWENSETLYRHTIAANSKNWIAYNNLSKIERERGNYEIAAELCRKALKVNPEYAHAHTNLGMALIEMGKLDEGIAELDKAYQLDDRMEKFFNVAAEIQYEAGTVLENKGDLAQAIVQYRRAVTIEPDYFEARFRLGVCLKNTQQLDEAETQFAEASKLKPDNPQARFNLGAVFGMQKKDDQALEQYREALRLDPTYAHAYNNLGFIYEKRGDFAQAVANYEKAVEYAPEMAQARNNLKRVKERIEAKEGKETP